jgi:hypothetical protein
MTTMTSPLLDPDRLRELLGLRPFTHSVELKLTVPDSDIPSTGSRLRIDPLDAELRQVVFFDTPELALSEAGVVVRARRIQGGSGDTVVKLRPVTAEQLDGEPLRSSDPSVEIDGMPGGYVCSASFKGRASAAAIWQVMHGASPARSLFSKSQRAIYKAHAPEGLKLNDLTVLGPINLLKLRFMPPELSRKMVAELWLYPDGSRILELSTKCRPMETLEVVNATRDYLNERGVDLTAEQAPKTKRALEYFSRLHRDTTAVPTPAG